MYGRSSKTASANWAGIQFFYNIILNTVKLYSSVAVVFCLTKNWSFCHPIWIHKCLCLYTFYMLVRRTKELFVVVVVAVILAWLMHGNVHTVRCVRSVVCTLSVLCVISVVVLRAFKKMCLCYWKHVHTYTCNLYTILIHFQAHRQKKTKQWSAFPGNVFIILKRTNVFARSHPEIVMVCLFRLFFISVA